MFNDGFCNICSIFKGHEDLKTLFGIFFCSDCRDLWAQKTKGELLREFQHILGYDQPPTPAGE